MPVALEQVLAPGFLDGVEARSLAELRALRGDCTEVEAGLSLLRRLVQGHLDIVGTELERRAAGAPPGDRSELLARLPEVLADRTSTTGPGRLSQVLAPDALDPGLETELSALVAGVADPALLDDAALRDLVAGLSALEQRVSEQRRALFDRIDALQREIARRYRDGDASVDALLT